MNISQLREYYWFHNGSIKSFRLDIPNNTAEIQVQVKKHINGKLSGQFQERDLVPCTLKLTFEDLIETSLFDRFPTQGYYLDFKSYGNGDEEVGISFNVHDNSSYTYETDNWVIKARRVNGEEV